MNKKPSYIFQADVIRVIAILGVVTIHIANAVYTRLDYFGGFTWWVSIILDSFSRISIPLFIMLSGFLLLGKNESLEQTLKRINVKILIPLVFWVLFYMWYAGGIPSFNYVTPAFFKKMYNVDIFHLYFLVILIGLYFIAPLIRSYIHNISTSSQNFFMKALIILGVSDIALQFIFNACASDKFFTRWVPYAGLFVAGYLLGTRKEKFNNIKLTAIYLLALSATLGLNYFNSFLLTQKINLFSAPGCLSHYSDHYLSVNVVFMSISAFLLLLNNPFEFIKKFAISSNLIHSLARASFGIYLIHPFVARFLEMQFRLAIDFSPYPIYITIFLRLFLVLLISYLITVVLSRIPFIKLLLGVSK